MHIIDYLFTQIIAAGILFILGIFAGRWLFNKDIRHLIEQSNEVQSDLLETAQLMETIHRRVKLLEQVLLSIPKDPPEDT